jgi:site-specific recombinase XerD
METMNDLATLWKADLQSQDRSAGTIKKYTQAVLHFLAWYKQKQGRPLTLQDITPITLISYRNEIHLEQRRSIPTINLRISALRSWCAWLTKERHLNIDPSSNFKLVSGAPASQREGLTNAQINALLRAAQSSRAPDRNYAIVQILLQTGIRLAECASLAYGDITFGERSGLLQVRASKGNKFRSVPLNASAREALAKYVGPKLGIEKPSIKTVSAAWPKGAEALKPIWASQRAGTLTVSAMGQMIANLVDATDGLVPQETTARTLRHTFARNYLAQYQDDVVGLATLLGHKSIDTTRIYSAPSTMLLSVRLEQLHINAYT